MGVREMMEMTPCDIFAYIRGRTVWLVGDSMMQVGCKCCETSSPPHSHTTLSRTSMRLVLYSLPDMAATLRTHAC